MCVISRAEYGTTLVFNKGGCKSCRQQTLSVRAHTNNLIHNALQVLTPSKFVACTNWRQTSKNDNKTLKLWD